MKLSIVIPTMSTSLLIDCVNSIIKYTDLWDIEIIVVANGAKLDLKKYIRELQKQKIPIRCTWHEKALGAVPALNVGIKKAKGEYIMLLNDDCQILESKKNYWVEELMKPFSDPEVAVTGPFKMTPVLGGNDLIFDQDKKDYGFIVFFCAIIPRRIFKEIGLLDEELRCGVDVDFCMKVKEKGYKIKQVPEETLKQEGPLAVGSFPFYHKGEGTVHDFYGETWDNILKFDAVTLNNRYGIKKESIADIIREGYNIVKDAKNNKPDKPDKPEISITITAYGDNLDYLQKCIDSIKKYTDLSNIELLVIANGCDKKYRNYLLDSNIKYIWYDNPLGATSAINESINHSYGCYIIILNQDVEILGKEWLPMLLEPFSDPKVGITGPLKLPVHNLDCEFIQFFCAAIKIELVNDIGLLDTKFNPGGFEDIDYSIRALDTGWSISQVPLNTNLIYGKNKVGWEGGFPIYHAEHHSEWMQDDTYNRNKEYLFNKHPNHIIEEDKIKDIVIPSWPTAQKKYELMMVQEFLKGYKIKKVLEVGTYRGGTAMLWAHMVKPNNGKVYCTDLKFDWGSFQDHGYVGTDNKNYRRQVYNDSEYEKYITELQGDSHDPDFINYVKDTVGKVDIMFIDGDHSYIGVKSDFINFSELVNDGGYVIFHDIIDSEYHRSSGCNVATFWNEIKDEFLSWQFIDSNEYPGCPSKSMGIGVLQITGGERKIDMDGYDKETEVDDLEQVPDNKVTAYISTKDRYHTTLPMAIMSILNQTKTPDEFILIDDGQQIDLRNDPTYLYMFAMLDEKNISWRVLFGKRIGQVANHQILLGEAKHSILWRLDDDNFAESNVLETLYNKLISNDKIGAVASTSLVPGEISNERDTSGLIKDIFDKANPQWSKFNGEKEVEHLHNSFLFKKAAAVHGYMDNLSPVGHREETMFTHQMFRNDWKLIVIGDIVTWHLRQPSGGIRSNNSNQKMWEDDEKIFIKWLNNEDIDNLLEDNSDEFIAVLDSGLGDHIEFLKILPEIKKKYEDKKIILATCFPDVFKNEEIEQISIAEAKTRLGNIDKYNIYKFMVERDWKKSILKAYERMYL